MPMPLAFPGDRNCDDMASEYMYGGGMLITVFSDKVYLPEGTWYDFWTNEKKESKGETIPASYDRSRYGGPVYVREGEIIPFQHVARHACERPLDTIVLNIWPADKGEYTLWEDDGVSYEHENGAFATTRFSYAKSGKVLTFRVDPVQGKYDGMYTSRTYEMCVTLPGKPRSIKVAGEKVKDYNYGQNGLLTFCASHPDTSRPLEIEVRL